MRRLEKAEGQTTSAAILKAELVCPTKLETAGGPILVSISGGADSDIVMDLVERFKGDADIKYVWFDTGLEYEATKRHLPYLEERYGVEIEQMKAVVPIPKACKEHGAPFLSKEDSQCIAQLQRHGFNWAEDTYDELLIRFPGAASGLKWWCGIKGKSILRHAYLKEFMIENPPKFLISGYCCEGAKKLPAVHAIKKYSAVLDITGVRQCENGQRATANKSCFSPASNDHISRYRPIFFFTDDDKRDYGTEHGIIHSDRYAKYGMKRTGCAGCPFGSDFEITLKTIQQYEPQLYKAANAIFGASYDYTRKYREYKARRKALEKMKRKDGATKEQTTFYDKEDANEKQA